MISLRQSLPTDINLKSFEYREVGIVSVVSSPDGHDPLQLAAVRKVLATPFRALSGSR